MKSLKKAFDLLEYVISRGGNPVTPTECAEATHWNMVTCTRIMGELTELGYLEKVSRKSGYRPGPMTAALSLRENVYTQLSKASEAPLRRFASDYGIVVNLSVIHHSNRVMIRICSGKTSWSVWKDFRFAMDDGLPTSRLLLSTLSGPDREKIVPLSAAGHRELDRCFKTKSYEGLEQGLPVQGHLICVPGFPAAAFGYGVPAGTDGDEMLLRGQSTAREIEQILTSHYNIF